MPSRNFRRDSNAFAAATTSPPTTNRSVSRRSAPSPASPFPAPSPQSDSRSPMSTPRTPSVLRTLLPACLRTQPVVPPPPGASRDGLPLATCASPGKHARLRKEVPASCAGELENAAAPQHHVIAATAVSPLPHVRAAAAIAHELRHASASTARSGVRPAREEHCRGSSLAVRRQRRQADRRQRQAGQGARNDSAAQLQGLQSGARGGHNQSSARSRQAGSRRRAERGTAAAAAGVARRSTAGRRAGSGKGGVARVAPRGRPARGTAAGQVGVQGANSQQRPR